MEGKASVDVEDETEEGAEGGDDEAGKLWTVGWGGVSGRKDAGRTQKKKDVPETL
jgi:hypothetical protein